MMKGIASSPGIGAGRVFILHEREVPLGRTGPNSPGEDAAPRQTHARRETESELERFHRGVKVTSRYYESLIERVRKNVGDDEAEIFEGHLEIITSDDIAEAVEEMIMKDLAIAEQAVVTFAETTAGEFEELESEYFRQRAGDIRDIGRRIAEAIYYGSITDPGALPENSVIVAEELTPSATARLDIKKVAAIATEKGGRTSHAAILARSLSIPCVTGVEGLVSAVRSNQLVMVDGDAGTVDTAIAEDDLTEITARMQKNREAIRHRMVWSHKHSATLSDGEEIHLAANVGSGDEAKMAASLGARGVGLFRSEFLFMRYSDFPGVKQQADEYRRVCEALAPHPVIVRLLDCGADKPLPYARQTTEDNPFLGERGIRFLMARDEQFHIQLKAIAQVAAEGHPIKVMIPMVISVDEIETVREVLTASGSDVPVGIMVETPASVLTIGALASRSDFISIGTNDLVQYLLAVDRGNARVASLYSEFHPAVIGAVDQIVRGSHKEGIHVGVCGDMASHPDTALTLLALGVDELSVSVSAIPDIKACLRGVDRSSLDALRAELLGNTGRHASDENRRAAAALVPSGPVPWEET
ncbi:MAG: phosphoenolpyruvate--protein phosphotransferase [Alkalispirochaeta sp.]